MALPTERRPPQLRLSDQTILIYGDPKSGKSTFVAGFPDVLFFAFEDGLKGLRAYVDQIQSWEQFIEDLTALEQRLQIDPEGLPYKTVSIDTLDNAYRMCTEYMAKKKGFEYAGDLAQGKGWALIKNEFLKQLNRVIALPLCKAFIAHARYKEIETAWGKRDRLVPNLVGSLREDLNGLLNCLFYVQVQDTKDGPVHQLRTKASALYDAGAHIGFSLLDPCPLDFDSFLVEWNSAVVHLEEESEEK